MLELFCRLCLRHKSDYTKRAQKLTRWLNINTRYITASIFFSTSGSSTLKYRLISSSLINLAIK